MSDFTKEKIAFAVALLATIFTITPVLDALGSAGFQLFGFALQVKHLFYLISASLGLSVYCYGIQFITERPLKVTRIVGDTFYALAIVAPVLYLLLFGGVRLASAIGAVLNSGAARVLSEVFTSFLAGVVTVLLDRFLRLALKRKEQQSAVAGLQEQGVARLRRAEELDAAGHHDLAVVEGFRALESAARREAIGQERPLPRQWLDELRARLPTEDLRAAFERLRRARNTAVHAVEPVSAEQAREGLATASKILAYLGEKAA